MTKHNDPMVDGDLIRALAALLEETGLSEIEIAQGDRRVRVARNAHAATAVTVSVPPAAPGSAAAPQAEAAGAVKSPMVGTAFLAPQPGAPHFVKVGDSVREGQALLVIEAMKVMNQIHAPRAGRVAEIRVADGTPVEFGQVLMVLE
ncbi:MAG TPA: acetyl-CoA carboxylase biotin carboxyl carrier protein subunit [Stellaceae bacterium]|nr:acetyl-CoA carboxylase biotin carboxyl carrier protein subunit [Stellaceae bacterium]